MVDDVELGNGPDRANKSLQYHPFERGFDSSWQGGAHVSYYEDGRTQAFRALETNAPENVPLILGGVKNVYIGQDRLQPYLGNLARGELAFIHREDLLIPIVVDSVEKKAFGQVSNEDWKGAGHSGIDSYITRLGGTPGNNHAVVAETLDHSLASIVRFHVATAEELKAQHLDAKAVADQVRQGRANLQANNPNAEALATRFAAGNDEEAGHSFQAATGAAIAAMRGSETSDRAWGRAGAA